MLALDAYRPDEWHEFFSLVGGAAAVLTGLVFVAMSLNGDVFTEDATHRYRAIDTLAGITAIFALCALALMGGQNHRAVGIEWIVVAAISISVFTYGHVQAVRLGGSGMGMLRRSRTVSLAVLYLAQLVGAAFLLADHIDGLYLAAVALVATLAFLISGAWLLVVDASKRSSTVVE